MTNTAVRHTQTSFIGVPGASRGWLISKLWERRSPALVITATTSEAESLVSDIELFAGSGSGMLFPSWESLPFESVSQSPFISSARISVLDILRTEQRKVVVVSAESLLQRVFPKVFLEKLARTLTLNENLNRKQFHEFLLDSGFKKVPSVEDLGEFAERGNVLDVFLSTNTLPVRIEFEHGRIIRISEFNPDSQRSKAELASVLVLPVRETISFAGTGLWASERETYFEIIKKRALDLHVQPRDLERIFEALEKREELPGVELISYIALQSVPSLLEYFPDSAQVFVVDHSVLKKELESFYSILRERAERISGEHELIPETDTIFQKPEELYPHILSRAQALIDPLISSREKSGAASLVGAKPLLDLSTKLKGKIGTGEAFKPLVAQINTWRKKGFSVCWIVGGESRASHLARVLLELDLHVELLPGTIADWMKKPDRYPLVIAQGSLSSGFLLSEEKLVFISERDVFPERSSRTSAKKELSVKKILSSLSNLNEDDYIVHVDYGVGIYRGLQHLAVDSVIGDFLHIEYADSTLYLPVQNIGRVQKFIAAEGQRPHIDKLGSTRWFRTKQKVKEAVVTLAGDLIKLYASRKRTSGWRFEPRGAEDERFAESFPYSETRDQQKAIQETLDDMASEKPTDRLVCGDVGFGKTEVAIRAAFKCTQHARQVAVLVPTTLLVEQHLANFKARFSEYPLKIEGISRFKRADENKRVLEAIRTGDADIVIGTHRLLQRDIQFKDLGLVIIDEEHRFGVQQKEKLKQMRTNVDVLTLTATPIPRTLNQTLLGLRDVSVIATAPTDRKVVSTFVAERHESLIRDAILREIRRNGQVFFLHNRIQTIQVATQALQELVPEARFGFAHGQMSETQAEDVMKKFLVGELDVLVTTSIIESGLDIPNANTIIIDRADMFGLAQLYQLRGRVGRSTRQAYAYLLVPSTKKLTPEAEKRLKVLQSLDELGIGFNLAVRDLEIRGAGNLLGKEQSGNVLSVGFDMYCKILEEAVLEIRGEQPTLEDVIDPEVKLIGVEAYIPEPYVPDIGERLLLYQRLANLRDGREIDEIRLELEDRFGPVNIELHNLLELMRFRSLLRKFGVVNSEISESKILLAFAPQAVAADEKQKTGDTRILGSKVSELIQKESGRVKFSRNNSLAVTLKAGVLIPEVAFRETERILERIKG